MKFLLCNQDENNFKGGDSVQLRGWMEALKSLGHEAEYSCRTNPVTAGFDYALLHHLNFGWTLCQARTVRKTMKYSVMCIYYHDLWIIKRSEMQEICDGAEYLFCLSEKEAEELVRDLGIKYKEKIKIVPNGVDVSLFNPKQRDTTKKAKNAYTHYDIISASRFGGSKGHHYLVNALKKLSDEGLKLRVQFVGQVDDNAYLSKLRNDMAETIHKYEFVLNAKNEEMPIYYKSSDILAFCSISERNSLVVLEAAACGCKIINSVYNRGKWQLPESIIVNPEDDEEVIKAIKTCLKDFYFQKNNVPSWKEIVATYFLPLVCSQ